MTGFPVNQGNQVKISGQIKSNLGILIMKEKVLIIYYNDYVC